MKKVIVVFFWTVCVIFTAAVPVSAETYTFDGAENSSLENAWEELLRTLPEELRNEVAGLDPGASTAEGSIHTLLSLGYWKEKISNLLKGGLQSALSAFTSIIGVLLLTAVCKQLPESTVAGPFAFCSDLCMALTVFGSARSVMQMMEDFLEQLCRIMTAMIPVMAAVSMSAGEVASASVNRTGLTLFVTVLNQLQRWLFMPLGQALYSISIVSAVCTQVRMGGFIASIRKLFMTLFSFMMLFYSFVYGMQNTLAKSADSLGLRTVKFALGSFIPIVGGTVSDAFSAVREGLGYVKAMTGAGGILILLCMVLPVAVSVWCFHLVLSCSQTAAELLDCTQSARLLADTQSILQLLSALVWLAVTFFCFSIILFTKTSVHAS